MDEQAVQARAEQMCDALVAGDIDRAFSDASDELRRHLGEVVGLLPLPVTDATVETIDRGGSGYAVVMRLIGETDEVQIQVRWKDRDGEPRIVEASHLSRTQRAEPVTEAEGAVGEGGGAEGGGAAGA
jgi:hypothetical protein